MINAYWETLSFEIQAIGPWQRIVDTALPSPADIVETAAAAPIAQNRYDLAGRSIAVVRSGID